MECETSCSTQARLSQLGSSDRGTPVTRQLTSWARINGASTIPARPPALERYHLGSSFFRSRLKSRDTQKIIPRDFNRLVGRRLALTGILRLTAATACAHSPLRSSSPRLAKTPPNYPSIPPHSPPRSCSHHQWAAWPLIPTPKSPVILSLHRLLSQSHHTPNLVHRSHSHSYCR